MNRLQIQASDPKSSVWVSASAGTGKTKILTDRVLRLLLEKVELNKILCLTFTNAAANEMKERISSVLADWSSREICEMKDVLYQVLGRECTDNEVERAVSIYSEYLNSDEKINIYTIHSFCQKLLKKFPLEAGISPSFSILDETKSYAILRKIRNEVLGRYELSAINNYLNVNFHEVTINEIISEIIQNKSKFLNQDDGQGDILQESNDLINALNISNDHDWKAVTEHHIIQNIVGVNTTKKQIINFFLTSTGEMRKKIVPAKIAKPGSNLYTDLEKLQEHVYSLDQAEKSRQLRLHSKILTILGKIIIEEYELYKRQQGLLDYDDLIVHSKKLLKTSEAHDWILYKLDGGIEHLLVDEAQDTSVDQWSVIESLIEEFYVGEADYSSQDRTVFIVGDEKQSIFSFQGADVESFSHMNERLRNRMFEGKKNFKNIELEISYRSAQEILDGVDIVFNNLYQTMPELFASKIQKLVAKRDMYPGSIEIWPLCKDDIKSDDFWPVSLEDYEKKSSIELANKIALFIKKQLDSRRILSFTKKEVRPSDFMILFRRRNELTNEVIQALKRQNIDVSGLDRISLSDNLAIMDLVSVAKFVLNPEDNLNLCALLKSSIINLSEVSLSELCNLASEEKKSVWKIINLYDHYSETYKSLDGFIELYKISHVGNFFHYIADIMNYRPILNASCGLDSNDAIDELIFIANNFYKNNSSSIQEFIFWFNDYTSTIKRDVAITGKVRIMTNHAAKGLQAPIVIMCDTTTVPNQTGKFFWDDNQLLSARNSSLAPEYFTDIKNQEKKNALAEYFRLLYVGMTRAEEQLIICGEIGSRSLPENCWYKIVRDSLISKSRLNDDEIIVFGKQVKGLKKNNYVEENVLVSDILKSSYLENIFSIRSNVKREYINSSPLAEKDPMSYGLIFHKILEDSLSVSDLNIMKSHPLIQTLSSELQERILRSINKIINNTRFCALIKDKYCMEQSFGTEENGSIKIGRIDLMIIRSSEVIIIDYKSDQKVPSSPKQVPKNYKKQLDFYATTIQKIYPDKCISTMILWLEKGHLMQIS